MKAELTRPSHPPRKRGAWPLALAIVRANMLLHFKFKQFVTLSIDRWAAPPRWVTLLGTAGYAARGGAVMYALARAVDEPRTGPAILIWERLGSRNRSTAGSTSNYPFPPMSPCSTADLATAWARVAGVWATLDGIATRTNVPGLTPTSQTI